ncbi:MAG: putative LPS assembly protein LptD [bacterium]
MTLKRLDIRFLPFFIFLFSVNLLFGQEKKAVSSDTTHVSGASRKSDLEGPITYEAQIIDNLMTERKTVLTGRAKVAYMEMTLTAAKITLDWDNDMMTAEGVLDSVWVKAEDGDSVRAVRLTGIPEFSEAGDVLRGEMMVFNFRTRKGRVLKGRTNFEDGFYSGGALKMVKPKSFNVANAVFTTCDKEDEPHFHFRAQKMKIDVDSKVIAKPIVMYIGHIPVAALPFIYFPIRKGRHSGILIPRYGESTWEGRYLRGLGYYWAASDYWDAQGTVDYFEKSGFLFRGDFRYAVRYNMQGSISGSWTRKDFAINNVKERRWDLAVRHSQTISPTMDFTVSGQFISSGNFYRDVSANREQRLQQEMRSNATLTKRFGGSKSMTINLNQTRNLETGEINETMPTIYFRGGQSAIIPKPKAKKGEVVETRWYYSIYASYSSQLLSQRSKRLNAADSSFAVDSKRGWDHSMRFSSPQKLFVWLTLNPSMNYRESWFTKRKEYFFNPETGAVESSDQSGFFARRTFDVAASFGTKIYGIFQPRFLKDVAVRHVATPSLSLTYQPDFSQERYGYYQTAYDTAGGAHTYDRYSGSLFGSTLSGGRKALNFSLHNLFQMKMGEGEKAKKFDLFSWSLSSAYNWKAEHHRLSDLSSSLRANPTNNVSFDLHSTYSFYEVDESGNTIDRVYVDEISLKSWKCLFGEQWLRMTNLSMNLNFRLKGKAGVGTGGGGLPDTGSGLMGEEGIPNQPMDRLEMDESVTGFNIPWNLSATLSYSESRYNPNNPTKTFWMRTNLDFNLTKHWKISYRAQFDLKEKKAVSQDFVFYRDLHCWEARIVWTPTGYNKRFYFKINVKSPMLQDIKLEKGSGTRGFSGTSLQGMW